MRQKFWLKQYQYRASVTFIRRAVLGWNIKKDKFEIWLLYESEMGPDQAKCQIHKGIAISERIFDKLKSKPKSKPKFKPKPSPKFLKVK